MNFTPPTRRAVPGATSGNYADEQCAEQQMKRSAASVDGVWPDKTDAGQGRHRPLGFLQGTRHIGIVRILESETHCPLVLFTLCFRKVDLHASEHVQRTGQRA